MLVSPKSRIRQANIPVRTAGRVECWHAVASSGAYRPSARCPPVLAWRRVGRRAPSLATTLQWTDRQAGAPRVPRCSSCVAAERLRLRGGGPSRVGNRHDTIVLETFDCSRHRLVQSALCALLVYFARHFDDPLRSFRTSNQEFPDRFQLQRPELLSSRQLSHNTS